MNITFTDGVEDNFKHPYLIILDQNNKVTEDFLLLKGKTFKPDRHTFYQEAGLSSFEVNLERNTIFNYDELYECQLNTSLQVFKTIKDDDLKDFGVGLYYAYLDNIIKGSNLVIFKKHKNDLLYHLKKNKLIQT